MPFETVNGIRMHYQEAGHGDPLILLMGWGGDHTAWALQVPEFSTRFRCLCPDNRGSGQTDQPDAPYTIRLMADDTVGLLDALGIHRAHVAGLSMGGMIAQEMAINYPGRVRTLQLHATLARYDPSLRPGHQTLLRIRASLGREDFIHALLPWLFTPGAFAERPELLALMSQRLLDAPHPPSLTGLTRQGEAAWAHDALDRLGRIRCPTLITVGAQDIMIPPRYSRELHERIPGAQLRVIEGGGHGYLWEQAAAFNAACLEFLSTHA